MTRDFPAEMAAIWDSQPQKWRVNIKNKCVVVNGEKPVLRELSLTRTIFGAYDADFVNAEDERILRLAASAPQLLAALEELLEYPERIRAIEQARAAISKATKG